MPLLPVSKTGPVMQFAFRTVHFDATGIRHQRLKDSARVFAGAIGTERKAHG